MRIQWENAQKLFSIMPGTYMIIKVNRTLIIILLLFFHPERELSVVSAYSVVIIDIIIQGKRE